MTDRSVKALAWGDPSKFALLKALRDEAAKDEERARCEASLLEFLKAAWPHMQETAQLSINWHHEVMIEYLEMLARGEIRDLIINIPPRHTKSLLTNVAFPAWLWTQDRDPAYPLMGPHVKFLTVSYGAALAEKFGLKMLNLVMGEWYRSLWGDKVKIRTDQQSRKDFANTKGGERFSASVEGGILGHGGDCISGDTKILTNHGLIAVKHIDTRTPPKYILTYDQRSQAPTYRRLIAISRRRTREFWRIHTRHGHVVEATGNHPIFTKRGWIKASSLTVGDVLLCSMWPPRGSPGECFREISEGRVREILAPGEGRTILRSELCEPILKTGSARIGSAADFGRGNNRWSSVFAITEHISRPSGRDSGSDADELQILASANADIRLCYMPEAGKPKSRRNGQVGSPQQSGTLLQPELRDDREESIGGKKSLVMRRVRQAVAAKGQAPQPALQQGVQDARLCSRGSGKNEDPRATVRDLRDSVSPALDSDPWTILFSEMSSSRPFEGYERGEKPGISTWACEQTWQSESMARSIKTSVDPRLLSVCDLQDRPTSIQHRTAITRSSYQPQGMGSSARECGLPLRALSPGAACSPEVQEWQTENDEVCLVERICGECDQDFYDLQIEETRCFFANNILIHNCQIIDDPHHVEGAESEVQRKASLTAFSESLPTRITDPRIAARILIMQRLHEEDCTDWALDHWPKATMVHLMFPSRFDVNFACPQDPRTKEREPLWPQVWDEEYLARMEFQLGPHAFAGQFQQVPVPREGGHIDAKDWRVYPEEPPDPQSVRRLPGGTILLPLPDLSLTVVALDTAMSEKETADWNACAAWGIWHRRRNDVTNRVGVERPWFASRWASIQDPEQIMQQVIEDDDQPRAIMLEAWRRRCKLYDEELDRLGKPKGLAFRVLDTCRRRKADYLIIEESTRAIDVIAELRRMMQGEEFQIVLFNPRKHGDKLTRAIAAQPLFGQGLVYAPGNYEVVTDIYGRQFCEVREELVWVKDVIQEVARIPRGRHDDLADVTIMPLLWLRENGFLELTKEYVEKSVQNRYRPYARADIGKEYGVR